METLNTLACSLVFLFNLVFAQWALIFGYINSRQWQPLWQTSNSKSAVSNHISVASQSAVDRVLTVISEKSAGVLYSPLTGPHSIRLIEVHGRDTNGYITCSIRVAHILQDKFVALSHVWGTDAASYKIFVNDQPVWVRPNLFSFLSLAADRKMEEGLVDKEIWIDALCINQIDVSEKQRQIPHMGVIFEQATHVVSWLHGPPLHHGPDPNGSQSLKQVLDKDFSLFHKDEVVVGNLIRLAEHEYWSRLWIVQEMHLAKQLTLYWQGQMIHWPQLQEFLLTVDISSQSSIWRQPDTIDQNRIRGALPPTVRPFLTLLQGCFSARRHLVESRRSLKQLIVDYTSQSCLELYDRVFALLALSADRTFVPNYDMQPISLLAHVMLASEDVPDSHSVSRIGKMLGIEVDQNALPNDTSAAKLRVDYLGTARGGEKACWNTPERLTDLYEGTEICTKCETFDLLHVSCLPGTEFFFAFNDRKGSASKVVSLEYVPYVEVKQKSPGPPHRVLHFGVPCREIEGMTNVLFEYDMHADKIFLKEGWYGLCNLFKAWHINRYSLCYQRKKKQASQSTIYSGSRRRSSTASCRYAIVKPAPD